MRMEVYKHLQATVLLSLLAHCFPGGPDRRLLNFARVEVEPVQIAGHRVQTVVAASYAIRVQYRNNFEYEVLAQSSTLLAFQAENEKLLC